MDIATDIRSFSARYESVLRCAMNRDKRLRAKLAKLEALFRRTGSPGEKSAAGAAIERLRRRLAGAPVAQILVRTFWSQLYVRSLNCVLPDLDDQLVGSGNPPVMTHYSSGPTLSSRIVFMCSCTGRMRNSVLLSASPRRTYTGSGSMCCKPPSAARRSSAVDAFTSETRKR